MFTFLLWISTIQGCSTMRQGVARREDSRSRLQQPVISIPKSILGKEDCRRTNTR